MARLVIYEELDTDDTVFETFELTSSRILIGSDHDNHLVLDMPDIDMTHASLELRDNHWFLQDLGGPGGTAVNGQDIAGPCMLRNNDIIELSFIKMRFENNERGVTEDFPRESSPEKNTVSGERPPSGRLWFAGLAMLTVGTIIVILILMAVAHYLGLISLGDLLPPGF